MGLNVDGGVAGTEGVGGAGIPSGNATGCPVQVPLFGGALVGIVNVWYLSFVVVATFPGWN